MATIAVFIGGMRIMIAVIFNWRGVVMIIMNAGHLSQLLLPVLRRRSVVFDTVLASRFTRLRQIVVDINRRDRVVNSDLADKLAALTIRDAQRLERAVPLITEVLLASYEFALTIVVLIADDASHFVEAPDRANDLEATRAASGFGDFTFILLIRAQIFTYSRNSFVISR